jgi:hypothetical protein
MRLLQWAALRRDREQFIYNWMLEDNLDLEQGSWKDAKQTRGKTDKPGSHVGSRSGKEDTGKRALCKPSRDTDSRRLVLAVMLDQGPARETQAKGHLCKPSRDVDSRKPRALLCKPSRDVDSCKLILAVMLDQGLAKKTQEKGHLCKPDGYIWKLNIGLVRYSPRKRKEKGKRENWTKGVRTRPRIARNRGGLSSFTHPCTSHLAPHSETVNPTPPLSSHLNLRYQDPNGQCPTPGRSHFRHNGRLDGHSVCSSHASYTCGQRQQ